MPLFENALPADERASSGKTDAPAFGHRSAGSRRRKAGSTPIVLPPLSEWEEVIADYRAAGLSLRGHPLQFVRPMLERLRVRPACRLADLPVDRRYKVAGLVLLRQRPSTARGITFVTLEDETGTANLIVRPEVWERYHRVAQRASVLIAHGRLQRQDEVIHLLVDRLEDLSSKLGQMKPQSRDFR